MVYLPWDCNFSDGSKTEKFHKIEKLRNNNKNTIKIAT